MDFFEELFSPLVPVLGEDIVNLIIGLLILIVGYVVAKVAERVVVALLKQTGVDDRLARRMDEGESVPSVERSLGRLAFYLILLVTLIAFFDQLELTFITEPLNRLLAQIVDFVPNLLAAGLILLAGYLLARILRSLVTSLTRGLGAEALARQVGLTVSLSQLVGVLVYALVLIPTIIAALNALEIEAIAAPATEMLQTFLDAIPGIVGAALLLALAYFVGKIVADIVGDLLTSLGFNQVMSRLGWSRVASEATVRTPADIAGKIVLVAIMLFAAMEAAGLMGFEFLAAIIADFLAFGGRLLLGLVILAIGFYLANLARDLILSSAGENAALTARLARWAILVFTGAIALKELGVADAIINLAFGLTLGAVALAAALAFGLGARDVAGREAERLVETLQSAPAAPRTATPRTQPGEEDDIFGADEPDTL